LLLVVEINPKGNQKLEEAIEEGLYLLAGRGWETEEKNEGKVFKVYFKPGDEELEELERFLARFLDVEVTYKEVEEKNWAEIWKANFRPLRIGKRLLVLPPWEEDYPAEENQVKVIIEPGQAFGTGHHPTTQMMLENLEEVLSRKAEVPEKILDLGCGTGILGITALKLLNSCKVWAVDLDEEALKACTYNAGLNQVEDRISVSKYIPEEKFDLILANIGFKELINLSEEIKNKLSNGGMVFLSGILKEDLSEMEEHYKKLGFVTLKKACSSEWGFLSMKKSRF